MRESRDVEPEHGSAGMLRRIGLSLFTALPVFLAFAIIATTRGTLSPWRMAVSAFVAGISGLIVVLRGEVPMALGSVRRAGAVAQGAAMLVICWGSALYLAILALR